MLPVWLYAYDGRALYCVYVETPLPGAIDYQGHTFYWSAKFQQYRQGGGPYHADNEVPQDIRPVLFGNHVGESGGGEGRPGATLTKERLKQICVEGCDRILNHPFLIRLKDDEREVLLAQRQLFQSDDAVLDRLLSVVQGRVQP